MNQTSSAQRQPLDQAASTLQTEQQAHLPVLGLQFISVSEYTNFHAELAITEGDIVFHFYVTKEVNGLADPKTYWTATFPNTLSVVAEEYFAATYPRLKAAFTEENDSWWMRAYGFGMVLDPHALAYKFLERLDAALDVAMTKTA